MIFFISIGFAYLSTNLYLRGTGIFKQNSWDIYFDDVSEETYKTDIVSAASIDNKVTINSSINLRQPKSTYTLYSNIVNDGSIDAMLDSWTITNDLDETEANIIDLDFSYADSVPLSRYDLLQANSYDTIKVTAVYKDDISNSDLLNNDGDLNLTITLNYILADEDAVERETSEVTVTYDYNDELNVLRGQIIDTGYQLNWSFDFTVKELINFNYGITNRYLFFGNYDNTHFDTINVELKFAKLRVYFGDNRHKKEFFSDEELTAADNVTAKFNWYADTKSYSFTSTSDSERYSIGHNVGSLGSDVGNTLRIGSADYR